MTNNIAISKSIYLTCKKIEIKRNFSMLSKERRESMVALMRQISEKSGKTWRNNGKYSWEGLLLLLKFARVIYVVIAAVVVCHGFYNAYLKYKAEDVATRQEYQVPDKLRYPSVTFCYKYKHGSKRIFNNFLQRFYEVAKKKGSLFQ